MAKSRCNNTSNKDFRHYGGRGISMCEEWQASFLAFYKHIGPKPSKGHSIDRLDNDGNYEPGNVKWSTQIEQTNNQRNRKLAGQAIRKNNKSGIAGVVYYESTERWRAYIQVDGRNNAVGSYDNMLDACCARKSAELKFDKLRNRAI